MDNDKIQLKILKFLHKQHFSGKMNFLINIEEVIKGSGLENVDENQVHANVSYLYGEKFVNGIMTLGTPYPISIYINSKGITKYDELKRTKVGFLRKTRSIFGHSVSDYWVVIGVISTLVLGTYFLWLPPLQCQFEVGEYGTAYKNCPLGFQISRPTLDWSFDKNLKSFTSTLGIVSAPNMLGGVVVENPSKDYVTVIVVSVDSLNGTDLQQLAIKQSQMFKTYFPNGIVNISLTATGDAVVLDATDVPNAPLLHLHEKIQKNGDKIYLVGKAWASEGPLSDERSKELDETYNSFSVLHQ